jgi:hypothetical protein
MKGLSQLKLDLLEEIRNGKTTFGPGEGENALELFQPKAHALIELRDSGYIDMAEPHRESTTGNRYIDRIYRCKLI